MAIGNPTAKNKTTPLQQPRMIATYGPPSQDAYKGLNYDDAYAMYKKAVTDKNQPLARLGVSYLRDIRKNPTLGATQFRAPAGPVPNAQPIPQPTAQPTSQPTAQPTPQPIAQPTAQPTSQPVEEDLGFFNNQEYWAEEPYQYDTEIPLINPEDAADAVTRLQNLQNLKTTINLPTNEELQRLYQQTYEQQLADLGYGVEDRQARERRQREQYLADRGIAFGSEAYRGEQQALAEQRAAEAAALRAQASQMAEQRTTNEFNRAQQAAQQELLTQQAFREDEMNRINTLIGVGKGERELSSAEKMQRAQLGANLKIARANIGSSTFQFMKQLGLSEKELAFKMDEAAKNRAMTKEQFAKTLKLDVDKFKEQQRMNRQEILQWNQQFKLFSKREAIELDQMVKKNETDAAIGMINAKANEISAGAAAGNVALQQQLNDLDYLQNKIRAQGAGLADILDAYPDINFTGLGAERRKGGSTFSIG
jgi:hypothetical protein